MTDNLNRKLAAIMFADIVSYSRLMGSNEGEALKLLKDFENILIKFDPEFKHKVRKRMILSTMRIYATNFDSVNIASIITDRSDDLFDYKYQIDKDTSSSYYKKYYESKFEPSKGILFTDDELSQ